MSVISLYDAGNSFINFSTLKHVIRLIVGLYLDCGNVFCALCTGIMFSECKTSRTNHPLARHPLVWVFSLWRNMDVITGCILRLHFDPVELPNRCYEIISANTNVWFFYIYPHTNAWCVDFVTFLLGIVSRCDTFSMLSYLHVICHVLKSVIPFDISADLALSFVLGL